MCTARQLDLVDALCSRTFPAEPGPSGSGGPGHVVAALRTAGYPAERALLEEEFEAECEALAGLLAVRWGAAPQEFGLDGLLLRACGAAGGEPEEIPEPWRTLSEEMPSLRLWRRAGRWIALGVTTRDRELPLRLLAVATDVDPP
ncbi:hypothetical protein [Streptomyces sp. NPDC058045]|uniref:hypothetical protein n=1 Tax=Streptomyces sp. NPDC058045 TaxID=3346311 RepID=UPI0036EF3279